jgi:hypothetical protein
MTATAELGISHCKGMLWPELEDQPMRIGVRAVLTIVHLGVAGILGSVAAHAQTIRGSATIALKSGESAEVGDLYFVTNCRSILKSTPEVEILDGPPGVSVAVKAAMVIPRTQRCANQVSGGKLVITAGDIEDPSYTPLTVRVTYRTRDGDRKFSQVYNLSLFP